MIRVGSHRLEEERQVPRAYVETSTDLLEGIDEMIREGYYHDRTEAINDAIQTLLKQYKISKLHVKDTRFSEGPEDRSPG